MRSSLPGIVLCQMGDILGLLANQEGECNVSCLIVFWYNAIDFECCCPDPEYNFGTVHCYEL